MEEAVDNHGAPAQPALFAGSLLPELIFVNGPSSAGKTTLCRALQAAMADPYLCIGFDDFVFYAASRYYLGADTPQQTVNNAFTELGAQMVTTSAPNEPLSVTAVFGPVFRRLVDSMPVAVRALVDAGNAVIFDDVLHDRQMYDSRLRAFAGLDVFAVGVTCSLEMLEKRERSRGDRVVGRARGLASVVHEFCSYDVLVDTTSSSVEECVAEILAALANRRARAGLGERHAPL